MVPASITATATLGYASDVVSNFGPLVLIVGGIAIGVWGIRFLIGSVKKSVRG